MSMRRVGVPCCPCSRKPTARSVATRLLRRASLVTQVLAAKPIDAALEALVTPAEAQDDRIAPAAAPGARWSA